MKNYIQSYNQATKNILDLADKIDAASPSWKIESPYTLHDITNVLREKFKDHLFRDRFVGHLQFQGFTPFPKGFCALSAICVYNLYGGDAVWEPSAIHMGTWKYAPVVFLRSRDTGIAFDPTGDQFAPIRVPYELGTPINRGIRNLRTPNRDIFIKEIKLDLDTR